MTLLKRKLSLAVAGLAILGFAIRAYHPSPPMFQGKSVDQWIDELQIGVGVFQRSNNTTVIYPSNLSDEEFDRLLIRSDPSVFKHYMVVGGGTFFAPIETYGGRNQILLCERGTLEYDPAGKALRSMGASALPCLTAKAKRKDSPLNNLYQRLCAKPSPFLKKFLPRPSYPIHDRANAAYGLGLLGPAARPALPILTNLLRDDHELVRAVAAEAWRKIDPEAAMKALAK